MHEYLRWTTYRGDVLSLEDYVRGNTEGPLHWHGQNLLEPDVVVRGDTAVLTAVAVDDVEAEDGRRTFRLRLTQTWVREDGQWRCLSGHAGPRMDEPAV
jgi:ketosteroid isomerase-like protein